MQVFNLGHASNTEATSQPRARHFYSGQVSQIPLSADVRVVFSYAKTATQFGPDRLELLYDRVILFTRGKRLFTYPASRPATGPAGGSFHVDEPSIARRI